LGVETLDPAEQEFHHAFSLAPNYNPEFAFGKLSFGWDAYCRRCDSPGHGPLGMVSFVEAPMAW
jgi:hypothetical protein